MSNPFQGVTAESESPDAILGFKDGHPVRVPVAKSNVRSTPGGGSLVEWSDPTGTALVRPDGGPLPVALTSTWANRPAQAIAGQRLLVTDLGTHQGGVYFKWTGARWAPDGAQDIAFDTVLAAGLANTNEQVLKSLTLPAGLLTSVNWLEYAVLFAKNGTTDAASNIRLRLGSSGTTSDQQIFANSGFIAGNRTFPVQGSFFASSSTEVRVLGTQGGQTLWAGASSSLAYPQNFTTPDLASNAVVLSASVQMAGSTNLGQVAHFIVRVG
jgi:hypothetical protein